MPRGTTEIADKKPIVPGLQRSVCACLTLFTTATLVDVDSTLRALPVAVNPDGRNGTGTPWTSDAVRVRISETLVANRSGICFVVHLNVLH